MVTPRLIAVDPSLTCSGWALFAVGSQALIAVGKLRSLPPAIALARRLDDLQTKVVATLHALGLGEGDIMVCESQTTMRDPKAAFKVEQVRGIFESAARARGMQVPGRVNPRSVQYEIIGLRGRQLDRAFVKESAVKLVESRFADELKAMGIVPDGPSLKRHQDIVDAILVGTLALGRVQSAGHAGAGLEELFAPRIQRRTRRLPR